MDNDLRDQQQAEQATEANNDWRDGSVGHQLVDLLEQSYGGEESL